MINLQTTYGNNAVFNMRAGIIPIRRNNVQTTGRMWDDSDESEKFNMFDFFYRDYLSKQSTCSDWVDNWIPAPFNGIEFTNKE